MKPVIDDFLNLSYPVDAKISPNGCRVAYTVRITNWRDNRYENFCYVFEVANNVTTQLTKTGSVTQIRWINDNDVVVLKNNFDDKKPQVWLYQGLMGDGLQLTEHPGGVEAFEAFGEGIIYLANESERKESRERRERYGNFTHFEQDESTSALYYTGIKEVIAYKKLQKNGEKPPEPKLELSKLLPEHPKITAAYPAAETRVIYLNCTEKDYLVYSKKPSCFMLKLDPEKALNEYLSKGGGEQSYEDTSYIGTSTKIPLPEGAEITAVSPDGSKIVIKHREQGDQSYVQPDLWLLDAAKAETWREGKTASLKKLTINLDQTITSIKWVVTGIYVHYSESTKTKVSKLSEAAEVENIDLGEVFPISGFDISKENTLIFIGANSASYPEVYTKNLNSANSKPIALTNLGNQVKDWSLGHVETIRWTSRDGAIIEGVIRTPNNFNPDKKYPLAFIVHGGPQAVSHEVLIEGRDITHYPSPIFAEKEIITVKPNYRGSMGRGRKFLALNRENLGVGDLWDVESCIDHLVAQGYVDGSRVGCMGWSQGGYISAMASTSSNRFKAVSVGAGISDWYTYHISTDIPHFTVDYLSSDPFHNREIYLKTSPMTRIMEAKTPTLIQHGEQDKRVPFSDATELYRGLKALGIQVELFTFPEMGHPIEKPKENRAIAEQNLGWFTHHLLAEKLELPK